MHLGRVRVERQMHSKILSRVINESQVSRRSFSWSLLILLLVGCGKESAPPLVMGAKVVESFDLSFIESDAPVVGPLRLKKGNGQYLRISFNVTRDLPEKLEGSPCQPPGRWPVAICVYPKAKERTCPEVTMCFFQPSDDGTTPDPSADLHLPVMFGHSPWWSDWGYHGAPPKVKAASGAYSRWTFLALRNAQETSYKYELLVWPCFQQRTSSELSLGVPSVLQSGELIIEP